MSELFLFSFFKKLFDIHIFFLALFNLSFVNSVINLLLRDRTSLTLLRKSQIAVITIVLLLDLFLEVWLFFLLRFVSSGLVLVGSVAGDFR